MIAIPSKSSRLSTGMSLIELIFSAMIVGIAAAGISGLVLLNNMSSLRTFNKVDSLNAARAAVERLSKDVRDSQMIGGQFNTTGTQFPSPENPTYGAGQTPTGGWPSAPWPAKPYTLSNTCLILQLPVFYLNPINDPHSSSYNSNAAPDANNGYPSRLDIGYGNPALDTAYPNVDTLVYQVLQDPSKPPTAGRPTEYILQMATFPGKAPDPPTKQRAIVNPPQTVLSGIVGPINPATGLPRVFQFLDRTKPTQTLDTVTTASNISGVVINFEVLRTDRSVDKFDSTTGIRTTIFMRNNSVSTP